MTVWCRALALALTSFAITCANTPAGPSETDQTNRVVIADQAGQLHAYAWLQASLEATLTRVVEVLPMTGLTITVTPAAGRAIGGYGVGGFTTDGRTVDLFIDAGFPNLGSVLQERANAMLVHEAHHAKRFRGPGYGRTLLEALVSEGLADHFAVELLNGSVPPWCDALAVDAIDQWVSTARPLFDSPSYGHEAWFFGAAPDIPRWTGYTLGYRLISKYKAAHPGARASALVHHPASAFRPE